MIPRDKLGVLSKIGQGGQGVVYRAPNVKTKFAASMVYKEYKLQARTDIDFTALAAMPALVEESLSYSQAERLISIAAWPCAIIDDAGTPTGFVMPAIPEEFFIPLTTVKGVSPSTAEFQHLLNHASVLAARGITLDDAQRYTLLRETASALVFLHKHGVCVGDISPKNLLFSLTPHEGVYFIDCDAMRINTVSALPQVETPGWNAPPGEELATIYTDTYKLGLLALRLLTGDHDTTNPAHLPATTPAQLRQIITDTLTNQPHQRPIPEAWTSVLGHAIEQAQHHKKTTAPDPVSAAPAPPPIPIVHSRPPVGPSAPPASASPPPPIVHSRPPVAASAPPPSKPASSAKIWAAVIMAAVVIAALMVVTVGLANHNNPAPSSAPETSSTISQQREPAYDPQVTLPFTGLGVNLFVAVDTTGNVYVTDRDNHRVLKLPAGETTPSVLPFTGLNDPCGVAVDTAGNVYVADWKNSQVLKLPAGSATQSVLPFSDLHGPMAVAVDTTGNVYVTEFNNMRVLKLPAGATTQSVLPFSDLNDPSGVAVDTTGNVYVADWHMGSPITGRVLKLPAGATTPSVLPFSDLNVPGVAVDTAGNVYVADYRRVLKLPAGSATPSVLPFTGLTDSRGVAVDPSGNVYVTDSSVTQANSRLVKLPDAVAPSPTPRPGGPRHSAYDLACIWHVAKLATQKAPLSCINHGARYSD